VRDAVRAQYGITEGSRVVLHAPTWRDNEVFSDDVAEIPLVMDVARAVSGLPGHVLLVRTHDLVTGRAAVASAPGVLDASYHPDISELYAAADVLVTDYSSCMFDFAITGRPMVFYLYDLEEFRDSIRGFYFDLLEEVPGPVVRDEAGLNEALRMLPATAVDSPRYAGFRERYTALEDGHATERVLARLGLGPG
jgi:CDP-glycerol glycerophosphotransferase